MSDRMRPLSFERLMNRVLSELESEGTVFGLHKLFHDPISGSAEPLIGPAAGPHTQLAQNIITAYAAGGRFFELATVQAATGKRRVEKPCILAADEGYSTERSTELTAGQALDEYVKAWFALKLLSRAFGWGGPDGFAFNMSVGYDFAGIAAPEIDRFIEGLRDASALPVWRECRAFALANLHRLPGLTAAYVDGISPHVCGSVTLPALPGCPRGEIERIAGYLMVKKGLDTFIKCAPTLVGRQYVRETLDTLGYGFIAFDDRHFQEELHLFDVIPMISRLLKLGQRFGRRFGVKLTSGLPVRITHGELPGESMYLSGRALFPLAVKAAHVLADTFGANLPLSFSGGAYHFNLVPLLEAGIRPVTVSTTLLKPGGYARLHQLACDAQNAAAGPLNAGRIAALSDDARDSLRYNKGANAPPRKTNGRKVPLLDCFTAPCCDGDPHEPDVPGVMRLADQRRYAEAARLLGANPLSLDGEACAARCVRGYYDMPVNITAVFGEVVLRGFEAPCPDDSEPSGIPPDAVYAKHGVLCGELPLPDEAGRCLQCASVCELCVQVCPNRANIALTVPEQPMKQILHIDALCSECGNCATFCPYDSAPYREKLTLFAADGDFDGSANPGFTPPDADGHVRVRLNGRVWDMTPDGSGVPEAVGGFIRTVLDRYPYLL